MDRYDVFGITILVGITMSLILLVSYFVFVKGPEESAKRARESGAGICTQDYITHVGAPFESTFACLEHKIDNLTALVK